MNSRKFQVPFLAGAALCGLVLISSSCRKRADAGGEQPLPPPEIAAELQTNQIGKLPGAVYQSQEGSKIRWQPWTKDTLARAKSARRLVFCVIAMPQQPGFQGVLASLERDSDSLAAIHDFYVPVLVDGDASREMGLLTADLCAEIKRPLQLPLFVWMTHEGNPVAWIPAAAGGDSKSIAELFNQSHTMVSQMWLDVPEYVLKNSALDNSNRRARFEQRKVSKVASEQPAVDVVRSLRQLASLYDTFSRSFDEAGGLFPASSLELLASASIRPGLPPDVRARCSETVRELLKDLLPSPMFDPLDGGVFSSRRGSSWSLPSFVRDCPGQARVAVALMEAYRATGDARALEKGLGLLDFAEKSYRNADGMFAVGLKEESDPKEWLWSVEDIEDILGADDAAWWIKATRMEGLGNLPSEVDPRREFFRGNTLGMALTLPDLAAEVGQPLETFTPRFENARTKLLAARNARLGKTTRDDSTNAGATFRMVSAYAAAFGVTGVEAHREKAVALLTKAREVFGTGPGLRAFAVEAPDSIGAGRAFLYALALQSVLDVAAITADESWLVWAEDLATTAAEMFTGNGFLKECPDDAKIIDLPVTDLVMLFDDSTAGLVSAAESRLAELGRPLVASFSELATPMPTYAMDRPILHTDLLMATLVRHYRVTVIAGADISPELGAAIQRLSLRSIQRRPAEPDEEVAAGSAKVLLSGERSITVTTPEELQQAVLPSSDK
jgi:uncharacterized protein YyaL (SSP411 family)